MPFSPCMNVDCKTKMAALKRNSFILETDTKTWRDVSDHRNLFFLVCVFVVNYPAEILNQTIKRGQETQDNSQTMFAGV